MKRNIITALAWIFCAGAVFAADTCRLQNYLQLEGMDFVLPCFREDADVNGTKFSTQTLMDYPVFGAVLKRGARPFEGETFSWRDGELQWKKADASYTASVALTDSTWNSWALSAFYLHADRYAGATAFLSLSPAYELYMDGVKLMGRTAPADTLQPKAQSKELKIEPGYHVFVVKSLYEHKTKQGGRLDFSLVPDSGARMVLGADLRESYGLMHYLNAPVVYSPQISYKGDYIKLCVNRLDAEAGKFKTVYRIYRTSDLSANTAAEAKAAPVAEFSAAGFSSLQFASQASFYAYIQKDGEYRQIFVGELGGIAKPVYKTKDDLNGYLWDPQGRFMILTLGTNEKESANGLKHIYNPMDQWPYYRYHTSLARLDLQSGSVTPLTYGYKSVQVMDISPDGKKLLLSTSRAVDTIRQYDLQTVYSMNLENGETRELFSTYFGCSASFSPKADKLLVRGSEQIFKDPYTPGVGVPCDGCFIANDYDNDAFIYDIATGKAVNITEGFGPSVQNGGWEAGGAYIYFQVEEGDGSNLYAYNVAARTWNKIPAECEVINGFDVCASGLVYTGSSIDKPYRACYVKGNAAKAEFVSGKTAHKTVENPQDAELSKVVIGEHREWRFKNAEGTDIESVYYLPPDFDERKQYPCIVYYYGGTSPTPRALSMRYPKSVWASQGYVVLVLQPSGATGYSRAFSAAHVNNWGITVADEIISGVRQFCASHPFVDSTRLGCIGASYGGFMTQLLVTRTDLFAAAISHAGISSISSYWGEGYWGYLYGSAANAFSFPWNRRDIFVDQSPLFNADKVHTPLLLLHGTSDVNVPIGESWQMYKALRLLGRDVAMVTVAGEDHGIVNYAKRIDWEKTILAWFAKHLKNEPLWWNTLYPERKF